MKKQIILAIISLAGLFSLYAGDAAVFVDTGFSEDGNTYVFGQYGRTDKTFRGWAEIYAVDVAENDFVQGSVFKTAPAVSEPIDKTGKQVYETLKAKSWSRIKKYNCVKPSPEQVLYVCEDPLKSGSDEIVFKDFPGTVVEDKSTYHISLVPEVKGHGVNARSSFVIVLEKQDIYGNTIGLQRIGSPSVVRKGVTGYKIDRIFCDRSGSNIVFVVEKTMEDASGILIRYMVETAVLNKDLSVHVRPSLLPPAPKYTVPETPQVLEVIEPEEEVPAFATVPATEETPAAEAKSVSSIPETVPSAEETAEPEPAEPEITDAPAESAPAEESVPEAITLPEPVEETSADAK